MRLQSVKFKITVLYTAILGAILVLYSGVLYLSLYNTLYHDLDNELKMKVARITDGMNNYLKILNADGENALMFAARRIVAGKRGGPENIKDVKPKQIEEMRTFEKEWTAFYDKLDLNEDFIHIMRPNGKSLLSSQNVSHELRSIFIKKYKNTKAHDLNFSKFKFKKRNLRFIQSSFKHGGEIKFIIQIGTSQKPIIDLLENRKGLIFISIPMILVAAVFIGQFLVNKILAPVFEITSTARNITHEDLTGRIKTKNVDDEMLALVEAFNDMISRLEGSFQHIAEFSSQVAHELKTPIAIMRGEIELALRKDRPDEEYKRVLNVSLAETKRLLKTVDDLLLLAKLDYRPEIFHFECFDLRPFFQDLYEQTKILAAEKQIHVHLDLPDIEILIKGDKLHLRRLFFNIVHNAVKFTSKGGRIHICVKRQDKTLTVSIQDTGVGISKEDQNKVFNRFFHVEKPSQSNEPGNGLGLNIALSIAKIHSGKINLESQLDNGTTFIVTLPLA